MSAATPKFTGTDIPDTLPHPTAFQTWNSNGCQIIQGGGSGVIEITRRCRRKMNDKVREIEFEEGSGNVFADLGLEDADELFTRAQLGFRVHKILKDKGLK